MIMYMGRRKPGALTAASPGDTLYIPWHSFNDSGDSEATTGFAATDIEIFKNGGAVERATDSGYTATTSFDSRVGLNMATITLYNTTDDTGFFDAGSQYQVAVDAVTIDGKTVRHWIACFDIDDHPITDTGAVATLIAASETNVTNKLDTGVPASNRVAMDTGTLNSVDQTDTGLRDVILQKMDTGVPPSVWANATRTLTAGTNLNDISAADVWAEAGRTLTSFAFDTGVSDTVWKSSLSVYTDTGSAGNTLNRIDTGSIAANATTDNTDVLNKLDTGVPPSVWANATRTLSANTNLNDITAADVRAAMDTGTLNSVTPADNTPVLNKLDTGVPASVWQESLSTFTDTGSAGYKLDLLDTGVKGHIDGLNDITAADVWAAGTRTLTGFAFDTGVQQKLDRMNNKLDTGVPSSVTTPLNAKLDTGVPASVWVNATRSLTTFAFDTGISQTVWRSSLSTYTDTGSAGNTLNRIDTGSIAANAGGDLTPVLNKLDSGVPISVWQESGSTYTDTGSMGYFQDNPPGATVDTGLVNNAIWNGNVSDHVSDTGSFGYFQGRLMAVKGDTGAAHLDAGRLGTTAPAAALDTGATKDAVWGTAPGTSTRYLTGSENIDTGVANQVWKESNSTYTDTGSFGYGVNLHKLRNDTGAAVNLTAMHNGTGYTDPSGPSSRAQVDAIGTASGAALNYEAEDDNTDGAIKSVTFVGVQTSGTFASTETEDGTYHQIDDTTDAIDIVYQYGIGGGRTASEVTFHGYVSGGNDTITVQVYDNVGATWDTLGTIAGQAGTDNVTRNYPLLSKHTGTGADLGKVYLRFVCSGQSNPTLYVDQLLVAAVNIGQTVGYANGAVWVDTGAGNTNTESFVDGTADNPVSTVDAATTIAGNVGLTRFEVAAGGNFNLTAAAESYVILGHEYKVSLGGQSVANTKFMNFALITDSGYSTAGSPAFFHEGNVLNMYMGPAHFHYVSFDNNDTGFNAHTAGSYEFYDCISGVPGSSAPVFNFAGTGGATTAMFRRWSGGMDITLDSNVTCSLDAAAGGTVTVRGTGGTINIRGVMENVVDASGGAVTITQRAVLNETNVGDWVWDALDTGHTDTGSMGLYLQSIDTGLASGLTQLSTKIDTGVPNSIWIESGSTYTDTGSLGYKLGHLDTGTARQIANLDTGLRSYIAQQDTGLRAAIDNVDTGLHGHLDHVSAKLDTGVPASVWQESHSSYTDTGSFGYGVNVHYWKKDTGAVAIDAATGWINANAESIYSSENAANILRDWMTSGFTTNDLDTGGIAGAVFDKIINAVTNKLDTGVAPSVWQESLSTFTDTGSAGNTLNRIDTGSIAGNAAGGSADTGLIAAAVWNYSMSNVTDTGATGSKLDRLDTGTKTLLNTIDSDIDLLPSDVWTYVSRSLTTAGERGIADEVWGAADTGFTDTGSMGKALIDAASGGSAPDTGAIATAVWAKDVRALTAFAFDTGVADTVWKSSGSSYTDTGSLGYKIDLLDTGLRGEITALSTKVDTGVPASIDTTDTGLRALINQVDTGLRAAVDNVDTGQQNNYQRIVNKLDTGVPLSVWQQSGSTFTDTGSIGYRVDKLDTGAVDANIVQVNSTTVTGTGDTGTGDTWRPA